MRYEPWLSDVRTGIEAEALRLNRDGSLAQTPHPFEGGARHFAQDFAENQLEIITDPSDQVSSSLSALTALTGQARAVVSAQGELLWPMSMPPRIPDEGAIRLARFDESETGRRKELYRKGLAHRYGKRRQLISGVHVNISMGPMLLLRLGARDRAAEDAIYLRAARHLYRRLESLILLTGATPVAGQAFPFSLSNREPVVSVRNSSEGYADRLFEPYLDLSSVDEYVRQLRRGLRTASPEYHKKGLVKNGSVVQLSGSVFQSEKEFYAPVRLRQATGPEESQTLALERRGVGYLEIRCIDRNPFQPMGVHPDTLRLIHLLFLQGAMDPGLPWSGERRDRYLARARAAAQTRLADLQAGRPEAARLMDRTRRALESLRPLAAALDAAGPDTYQGMLERQLQTTENPAGLLSVELFRRYREQGLSWTEFGLSMAAGAEGQGKEACLEVHYAGL